MEITKMDDNDNWRQREHATEDLSFSIFTLKSLVPIDF